MILLVSGGNALFLYSDLDLVKGNSVVASLESFCFWYESISGGFPLLISFVLFTSLNSSFFNSKLYDGMLDKLVFLSCLNGFLLRYRSEYSSLPIVIEFSLIRTDIK